MKRFYVSLLLLVFSVICIFAADEIKTLEVSAIVPLDYGVVFPDDGLCIDRLYLAMESAEGDRTFLSVNNSSVNAGLITEYPEGMVFQFLFYGNLSHPYQVMISADAGKGLVLQSEDNQSSIPVVLGFEIPEVGHENVDLQLLDDTTAMLHVETLGAVSALDVLELRIRWDESPEFIPGNYKADLSLELTVI